MAILGAKLLDSLSPHLFWDVEREALEERRDRGFIVRRVLELGVMSDWKALVAAYGLEEIARVAISCRGLDKKAASFVACVANIPKEQFRCFEPTPSTPPFWSF